GISTNTAGSFDINSPFDFRTVNWSPDPNVLLNGGTDAFGNVVPLGLRAAFTQLAQGVGGPTATATITQVSNTQFTVTFGGSLGAQDLFPDPGPPFTITEHLANGSVTNTPTIQGAGLVNSTNNQALGTSAVPTAINIANGIGSESGEIQITGPANGGTF